jgi:hypothetical protein
MRNRLPLDLVKVVQNGNRRSGGHNSSLTFAHPG